jgi:histidinol-phosphate aminotransferase
MIDRPPFTALVAALPATVPFVPPEALERASGRPLVLRLGANESRFGVSPRAADAMRAAVERQWCYGDPESHDLRAALAARHGCTPANVSVGAGIDDLILLIARGFVEAGTPVVVSLGSYPTFQFHVKGEGAAVERVPYRDERNDLEALAAAVHRTRARIVYLANPDNPTGSWLDDADLNMFKTSLPDDCLLILDEAYAELSPAQPPRFDPTDPRVVRLRTFSKAYGMAGARIGYAITAAETVATLDKIRVHFAVNLVAQVGALAALDDGGFLAQVQAGVEEGRRDYHALARGLGLRALPSGTNFVAIDVAAAERARALVAALAARGVFVRKPSTAPLDRFVRVSVGLPDERRVFGELFTAALREL